MTWKTTVKIVWSPMVWTLLSAVSSALHVLMLLGKTNICLCDVWDFMTMDIFRVHMRWTTLRPYWNTPPWFYQIKACFHLCRFKWGLEVTITILMIICTSGKGPPRAAGWGSCQPWPERHGGRHNVITPERDLGHMLLLSSEITPYTLTDTLSYQASRWESFQAM